MAEENLGSRLRRIRSKKALSAEYVANTIQVPVSTYREWENGRAIRGELYIAICHVLKVSLWELLTGESPSSSGLALKLEKLEKDIKMIRFDCLKSI